jgi:hypothetical protein
MRFLQALLSVLVTIARTIAYGWLLALCALWKRLADACSRISAAKRIPVRERRAARGQCTPIRDIAFKKPDPLLYSQSYLMSQGLAVTWDNPDIALYRNGILVPSSQLASDTEYEMVARIWNNSTDAPVPMLPVVFSYLSFGIATLSHPIGSDTVNLGVKGGQNHPAFAHVKWRTPATPGHYCIQVFLDWFDDANPNNNLGQENTLVGTAHSPADFLFVLRNNTGARQLYRFEVDTYRLPRIPYCDQGRRTASGRISAEHNRQNFPVPPGWQVEFNPQYPGLAPAEEKSIAVRITPPADFTGNQGFNVNAFYEHVFAGGVTLYVSSL